jgi:hypothetical protein
MLGVCGGGGGGGVIEAFSVIENSSFILNIKLVNAVVSLNATKFLIPSSIKPSFPYLDNLVLTVDPNILRNYSRII